MIILAVSRMQGRGIIRRFISEDTYKGDIANPLSLNLYSYVHNNPLRYIDPSGHAPQGTGGTFYTNMKIAAHCANVGLGVCMKEAKAGTIYFSMEVVDFLFLDDINTILDPEASTFDKTLAAVGFIPIGKLYVN